jgi:hypothetical protein
MQAAEEMPEGSLVTDKDQGVVGLRRRGDVRETESDSSDYLDDESERGGASEDIPPAGVARNQMIHRRSDEIGNPEAVIEPPP